MSFALQYHHEILIDILSDLMVAVLQNETIANIGNKHIIIFFKILFLKHKSAESEKIIRNNNNQDGK